MTKRKSYDADAVVIIKDDRERVRKRPTNFIPTTDVRGAKHVIFEAFDNAMDEVTAPGSCGNSITGIFDKKSREMTVSDNGRGFPHEKMLEMCTVLNSSSKFDNEDGGVYEESGGTNGIGLKLAVFLSEYCEVTSMREGKSLKYRFEDGLLVDTKETKTSSTGTVITFKLSKKFLDIKSVTADMLRDTIQEKSYLFPDVKIRFIVTDGEKEVGNYFYKGKSIVDRVKEFKPSMDVIEIEDRREVDYYDMIEEKTLRREVGIHVALSFKEEILDSEDPSEYIISYGNTIKNVIGGTHVDGLKEGLVKFFKNVMPDYMTKTEKENLQILPSDITAGLCAYVVATTKSPLFRGQYKDQLINPEIKYAVRDAVYAALEKQKDVTIKKMAEFIKTVAKSRLASKKARKKDVSNAFSKDRIAKYYPLLKSIHTTHPEVVIVEGDSAADGAVVGRDKYNQAIYSITGRPTNLIDANMSVVEKAATAFNDIIDIVGCGLGKSFDVSKAVIKKIVIMTDGDTDGDGIAVALLGLIAKFAPGLVEAGMVYRCIPPLYSFKEGKKDIYVSSQKEFFKYIKKKFSDNIKMERNGKKFTIDDIINFIEINFEYKKRLDKFAKRYSADPKLMEHISLKYIADDKKNGTIKYWKSAMEKYKDLEVGLDGDYIIIDGTYKDDYVHIVMDSYFDANVKKFKVHQKRNLFINGYTLNNKENLSVYDVMNIFDEYVPSNVTRYKGLGEFNPKKLGELCMNIENRTLIKFKFKEDMNLDMNMIYVILSSKKAFKDERTKLLMNTVADEMEIDT